MDYHKLLIEKDEKTIQRIERYKKQYPHKDLSAFIERVNQEILEAQAQKKLMAQVKRIKGASASVQQAAIEAIENGNYARDFLRDKNYAWEKLLNYMKKPIPLKLIHDDFRTAAIADNSIDLIITDPPYPYQYINLYHDLAVFAARVLKPGGALYTMAGQSYLPEIFSLMQVDGLKYNWTLAYLTPGGQSPQLWQRKINSFWKPVLAYSKGNPSLWMGDVIKSHVNDNDKKFHFWGQSISGMSDLILRVSCMGETVLDPFMGGGSTGAVALAHHRNFIGIEIDKSHFTIAKQRLKNF
jgi:site-specific DNA-methyltransferase (adenine-specific)